MAFMLKSVSSEDSKDQNGLNGEATEGASACNAENVAAKPTENATEKTEEGVPENANEKDSNNERISEESEEGDVKVDDKTSESCKNGKEDEGKDKISANKDNKDVVLREDLKAVFQKFGTVKVCVFRTAYLMTLLLCKCVLYMAVIINPWISSILTVEVTVMDFLP